MSEPLMTVGGTGSIRTKEFISGLHPSNVEDKPRSAMGGVFTFRN